MKRRTFAALVAGATAALVLPLGVTASVANWNDREWVHATGIGTGSMNCGVDSDFASAASGDLLSGSLLGTDLDGALEVRPVEIAYTAGQEPRLDVKPDEALDLESPPPTYTFANPLTVQALSALEVGLTGLALPLPGSDTGAANQYAQVSGYGTAAGAAGAVSNSGGLLLGPDPDDSLPTAASISLTELLGPLVSGIAGGALNVGVVGASSVLDGCAALRSAMGWGGDPSGAVVRDYEIAGLDLTLDSPLIGNVVDVVEGAITSANEAVTALAEAEGALSTALRGGLLTLDLPGILSLSALKTTIDASIDLTQVTALLTAERSEGGVTVNFGAAEGQGVIEVDLARLLGGINDLPPNRELLLDSELVNRITANLGAILDRWTRDVTTALRSALESVQVTVTSDTSLILAGAPIINIGLTLSTNLGALVSDAGPPLLTVNARAADGLLINVIDLALGVVGLSVGSLLTSVSGLASSLTGVVAALARTTTAVAFSLLENLGGTLAGVTAPVVTAVGGLFDLLPSLVSIMVNVQPDQEDPPPGATYIEGNERSTPQYLVSALRIGVLGTGAVVSLATASAGPVSLPPRPEP